MRTLVALLISCSILFFASCQKEISSENGNGGGNGGGGNNGTCNSTVMRLNKIQSTSNPDDHVQATWNPDGTIHSIKFHQLLIDDVTATYIYSNGKITEAVMTNNYDGSLIDTAEFRYNAQGKVDSFWRKNDVGFGVKLTYSNGKLIKYTRYTDTPGDIMEYWDIVTDANDNIVKAEEYWNESTGFKKETTYTYTRDDRKNPLAGVAPYLLHMVTIEPIFWYWGPNNYSNQRYIDYTGTGTDLTTGYKYKYNNNCYPGSSQMTIAGQVVFADDDFTYTYY
jgi:hypothetical protein